MPARADSPQSLFLVRTPGPHGPTLSCRGELTLATREGLRRELALLLAGRHEGLVVDLTAVTRCEPEGAQVVVDAAHRLREFGGRFVVVPGRHRLSDGTALLVAADEDEAQALLRGDG